MVKKKSANKVLTGAALLATAFNELTKNMEYSKKHGRYIDTSRTVYRDTGMDLKRTKEIMDRVYNRKKKDDQVKVNQDNANEKEPHHSVNQSPESAKTISPAESQTTDDANNSNNIQSGAHTDLPPEIYEFGIKINSWLNNVRAYAAYRPQVTDGLQLLSELLDRINPILDKCFSINLSVEDMIGFYRSTNLSLLCTREAMIIINDQKLNYVPFYRVQKFFTVKAKTWGLRYLGAKGDEREMVIETGLTGLILEKTILQINTLASHWRELAHSYAWISASLGKPAFRLAIISHLPAAQIVFYFMPPEINEEPDDLKSAAVARIDRLPPTAKAQITIPSIPDKFATDKNQGIYFYPNLNHDKLANFRKNILPQHQQLLAEQEALCQYDVTLFGSGGRAMVVSRDYIIYRLDIGQKSVVIPLDTISKVVISGMINKKVTISTPLGDNSFYLTQGNKGMKLLVDFLKYLNPSIRG